MGIGDQDGEVILDYQDGPNVITEVLMGGRQDSKGQRRYDDGSRGQSDEGT